MTVVTGGSKTLVNDSLRACVAQGFFARHRVTCLHTVLVRSPDQTLRPRASTRIFLSTRPFRTPHNQSVRLTTGHTWFGITSSL